MKKGCLVVAAVLFLTGIVGLWIADSRYEALRAAPRISHAEVVAFYPSVRILLDLSKVRPRVAAMVNEYAPWKVPGWALDWILPYETVLVFGPNHDKAEIDVLVFVNTRRLGKPIAARISREMVLEYAPNIEWNEGGLTSPSRGALTLEGTVEMEPDSMEASWWQWDHTITPEPLPLDRNHLLEAVFDNRDGGSYVSVLSLLDAYNFKLTDDAKNVFLGTIRNALSVRITADVTADDAVHMRMAIEIRPESRKRLAVASMKSGIDDLLEDTFERLEREHGLQVEGSVEWKDNILVYDYRFEDSEKVLDLLINRQIF